MSSNCKANGTCMNAIRYTADTRETWRQLKSLLAFVVVFLKRRKIDDKETCRSAVQQGKKLLTKRRENLWNAETSLDAQKFLLFFFLKSKATKKRKTLHIVNEHSKSLSDGKLHCFGKQYWNQNKYFILISIDFNTRVCSPLVCFDILPNWRLSRYFDLEFGFKSFFLFASYPNVWGEEK